MNTEGWKRKGNRHRGMEEKRKQTQRDGREKEIDTEGWKREKDEGKKKGRERQREQRSE